MAILFGTSGTAFGTLFYKPSVKKSFLTTILPCLSEVFSNPFSYFNSSFTGSFCLKRDSEFIAVEKLQSLIFVGFWFGRQELEMRERITGGWLMLYNVLAP